MKVGDSGLLMNCGGIDSVLGVWWLIISVGLLWGCVSCLVS